MRAESGDGNQNRKGKRLPLDTHELTNPASVTDMLHEIGSAGRDRPGAKFFRKADNAGYFSFHLGQVWATGRCRAEALVFGRRRN
jgi:hypothetical protein